MAGDEKRRKSRTGLDVKLTLSIINSGTGRNMEPFDVDIIDVSATGIGFFSEKQLMVGEMFTGVLQIWTKQKVDVVLKIVRNALEEEGYSYGATFVGMNNLGSLDIEIYQMLTEK